MISFKRFQWYISALYPQASLLMLILLLGGCSSSGPKTEYYSLFPSANMNVFALSDKNISIGAGPVELPEYVEHPGIVSVSTSNRVIVSGYNAWAGDLNENIARVFATNLSKDLDIDQVWAFPWDNRIKPDYQIRLVFEDFSGVKGGEVQVLVRWTLLNKTGNKSLLAGKEKIQKTTQSGSYNDYVAALNEALNELSQQLAGTISTHFNPR